MGFAEDAMAEIGEARDRDVAPDVRTKLDSIAVSLAEMTDTERGEWTDADGAFADARFEGAAPSHDNLNELQEALDGLAEQMEGEARAHVVEASRLIGNYGEQVNRG